MKTFIRPVGHEKHGTSTTVSEHLSFGYGELDGYGFWEHGCYECAREWEKQFPESGKCWPFPSKNH